LNEKLEVVHGPTWVFGNIGHINMVNVEKLSLITGFSLIDA